MAEWLHHVAARPPRGMCVVFRRCGAPNQAVPRLVAQNVQMVATGVFECAMHGTSRHNMRAAIYALKAKVTTAAVVNERHQQPAASEE